MKIVAAVLSCWLLVATGINAQSNLVGRKVGKMVRISEIEIHSQYLLQRKSAYKLQNIVSGRVRMSRTVFAY